MTVPVVQTRQTAQVRVNARAADRPGDDQQHGMDPRVAARDGCAGKRDGGRVADRRGDGVERARHALRGESVGCRSAARFAGQEAAAAAAAARATQFATAVATAYGINEQHRARRAARGELARERDRSCNARRWRRSWRRSCPAPQIGTLSTAQHRVLVHRPAGTVPSPRTSPEQPRWRHRFDPHDGPPRRRRHRARRRALPLLDHISRDSLDPPGFQYRLVLGGIYRLATSRPDSARDLLDIGTGEGGGVEGRAALELMRRLRRAHTRRALRQVFRADGERSARRLHDRGLSVSFVRTGPADGGRPVRHRRCSSRSTSIRGCRSRGTTRWSTSARRRSKQRRRPSSAPSACRPRARCCPASTTVQRVGVGLRYSTVLSYLRHRAQYPIEVSYHHLETISGDAGAPKIFRDMIQLRLYYRLFR